MKKFVDGVLLDMSPEEAQEFESTRNNMGEYVPPVVSRFQARAALHFAGMLEAVEAAMAHPDTPMLAKLAWADAQEFWRDSPTVASMAAVLALTPEALDQLFIQASRIKA